MNHEKTPFNIENYVLRKEALNVDNLVIYMRISSWPNDEIIMIDLISCSII